MFSASTATRSLASTRTMQYCVHFTPAQDSAARLTIRSASFFAATSCRRSRVSILAFRSQVVVRQWRKKMRSHLALSRRRQIPIASTTWDEETLHSAPREFVRGTSSLSAHGDQRKADHPSILECDFKTPEACTATSKIHVHHVFLFPSRWRYRQCGSLLIITSRHVESRHRIRQFSRTLPNT